MSPAHEAATLPLLLLSTLLIAALRPGSVPLLAPPSLASLVTAMAVIALLVRSGALAPERLMNPSRTMLANLNGLVVLLSAFVTTAQIVTMLVPDSGVPAALVWLVLIALLAQALAIGPDRARLLRGLMVTLGAAFVLKFILLTALSTPADSRVGRALQLLFEGLTLGSVTQRLPTPAEGYLGFLALVMYLVGIAWLPSASWHMVRINRRELSA